MKVLLVRRAQPIAPFARSANACALGTGTVGSDRDATLHALGLGTAEEIAADATVQGPALVWSDDVWVTRRALSGFLKRARKAAQPVRLSMANNRLLELFLPLQDVPVEGGRAAFQVAFVPAGASATVAELFALPVTQWVDAPYKDIPIDLPVPRHILKANTPAMRWPLTSSVVMRVRHWLHVLRAGHLAPQVALLDRASSQPLSSALRLLMALRPTKQGRLAAYKRCFSYRGRGVVVHPTATVEASILEDGVTVGAYSYVVNSIVGAGSVIEQRAHVSGCALGPRTFVSLNSSLSACVTFGDTDACINGVQACVFAERGGFTSFALPLDLAVEGPVRVEDGGALRDAGELPCGVAFGAEVFVGARVVIAAGRAIPQGVRLYADGAGVLQSFGADLPAGSYAVVGGKPVGRAR